MFKITFERPYYSLEQYKSLKISPAVDWSQWLERLVSAAFNDRLFIINFKKVANLAKIANQL